MEIKDLSFEDGSIYIKRKISKEDFKNIFLNIKTKYKKYLTVFFEKYCNDTAMILTTTTYMTMLRGYLYNTNINIATDFKVTVDKDNLYVKLYIEKFYDRNFSKYTKDQLEFIVKNKLEDLEIEVLTAHLKALETDLKLKEKLEYMINNLIKLDDIIQKFKEKKNDGIEIKSSNIDSELLKNMFAEFSISVIKDVLKENKEYLEKNEIK